MFVHVSCSPHSPQSTRIRNSFSSGNQTIASPPYESATKSNHIDCKCDAKITQRNQQRIIIGGS